MDKYAGFHEAFYLLDTFGYPLEMSMSRTEEEYGMRVALETFIYDAILAGWTFKKAISVVWGAVADAHGSVKASEITDRLTTSCANEIARGILKTTKSKVNGYGPV